MKLESRIKKSIANWKVGLRMPIPNLAVPVRAKIPVKVRVRVPIMLPVRAKIPAKVRAKIPVNKKSFK